ncbi:uncharacterized protein BCR38DRAFT_408923 [Pseudomassariella vexata]|uniref:Uncharacterized protein n=1 Tax=Pseudomassariella vexata TaxID=1141098 RepID=A0A1Y2E0W2_9PEZI|nr:uncharacterized protein BCR38DRAFT_408923 [Pseudomassariella vexata]ORY65193.1 hypothetical protein BCR38DRAFT_408923 [Pseudomassariella vexata]
MSGSAFEFLGWTLPDSHARPHYLDHYGVAPHTKAKGMDLCGNPDIPFKIFDEGKAFISQKDFQPAENESSSRFILERVHEGNLRDLADVCDFPVFAIWSYQPDGVLMSVDLCVQGGFQLWTHLVRWGHYRDVPQAALQSGLQVDERRDLQDEYSVSKQYGRRGKLNSGDVLGME